MVGGEEVRDSSSSCRLRYAARTAADLRRMAGGEKCSSGEEGGVADGVDEMEKDMVVGMACWVAMAGGAAAITSVVKDA